MDNKTEYFTLKEDGVIGWIENMPVVERSGSDFTASFEDVMYKQSLQSAIDSAMEVANRSVVESELEHAHGVLEINKPYPLQCHVEKKEERRFKTGPNWSNWYPVEPLWATDLAFQSRTLALVTFYEPSAGVEETQEELDKFKDFRNEVSTLWQTWIARHYNDNMNDIEKKLVNRFVDELSEILTKFK